MSKKCPTCYQVTDDNQIFCSQCGSRLADYVNEPALNIGDGNAISGGVNIDSSKTITHHDTHYHSTVHERAKSDSELKLEATNQVRNRAEEIISERGRLDSVALAQLRPFALQLGIDDETFKSIIKDVRSNRNGGNSGLGTVNARYLQQAQQAVQTNDMDALSNLTPRLEAMAAISQDDNVQYLYYLTLSLLYPIKSMEVYERQADENYWRSFWAIVSYIRTGKYVEATKVLALFEPLRFDKSEEDQNLLEAYFNIMKEDKDATQEFLDEILGEPSEQIKPLLRAIESRLYDEEVDNLEARFYVERVLSKSETHIKASKITDTDPVAPKEVAGADTQAHEMYSEACAASGAKRVMLLQKAADAGSVDAMYDLADCYIDGLGVPKNDEISIKWMIKAADNDHALAQAAMGVVYCFGLYGIEQNYPLSEKYLKIAAEKNIADAQAYLAFLYINIENYDQAIVWARKAAQSENEHAFTILGQIYMDGLGVDRDPIEGLKWYEKAADKGDADSQNLVGNLHSDNRIGVCDLAKSFKYYQMAAAQNHIYGIFNLGLCYYNGSGCEQDVPKALELINNAAAGDCPEAKEWLAEFESSVDPMTMTGDIVDRSNMSPDEEIEYANVALQNNDVSKAQESVEIYRKHASKGMARAQCNLAYCYHNGFGVKQNFQQAASWYKKAAEQGYALAQLMLGFKYYEGYGCTINYQEAAKWFRKAANQGEAEAQFYLGLLYIDGNGVVMDMDKGLDLIQKSSQQGYENAINWLKESKENRLNEQPNITVKKVWVDTDNVGQLYIHCDWVANNMNGESLEFRVNLCAKTGKKIKYEWYYLSEPLRVKNKACKFPNTGMCIPGIDLNMSHDETKKVEFDIEFYKWGTNKSLYTSKKMTFYVWYYFNFFSSNKFEVRSQQCQP